MKTAVFILIIGAFFFTEQAVLGSDYPIPVSPLPKSSEDTLQLAFEFAKTLRQSGIPALNRSWDWEILAHQQDTTDVVFIPRGGSYLFRMFVPVEQINDKTALRMSFARTANFLCWLGNNPHPLQKPITPHWLTLALYGWLDVENRKIHEQIVALARLRNVSPTLQQIANWDEHNGSTMELAFRTAHCYWLLRQSLRERFLLANLLTSADELPLIVPEQKWINMIREARHTEYRTPFLAADATYQQALAIINSAPVPLTSALQTQRNKKNTQNGETSSVNRPIVTPSGRASSLRERTAATEQTNNESSAPIVEVYNQQSKTFEPVTKLQNTPQTALTSRTATNSEGSLAEPMPLREVVRKGRSPGTLNSLRQARYLATELAVRGHPAYRDAIAAFVLTLTLMEKKWDLQTYSNAESVFLKDLESISTKLALSRDALDWAEVVFLPAPEDKFIEEYFRNQKYQEKIAKNPEALISEIIQLRSRELNNSPQDAVEVDLPSSNQTLPYTKLITPRINSN